MKWMLACVVMGFFGLGCGADSDPGVSQEDSSITDTGGGTGGTTNVTCANPRTCAQECGCEELECVAHGGPRRICDEEKFQCVLDCK